MTRHGSSSARLVVGVQAGRGTGQVNPSGQFKPRDANARGFALKSSEPSWREKCLARSIVSVPQSDTGRRVEHTKAIGRTLVKELGNMAP
jgi:hypothetical protein